MKYNLTILFATIFLQSIFAHGKTNYYQYPEEKEVQQKIEHWQDLKFGLFIHWGNYSQWGVIESWIICMEDKAWMGRHKNKGYIEYKKDYENLIATFNPTKFNSGKWADAARYAGMKYVIFTTKHHDGFNMYYTDHLGFDLNEISKERAVDWKLIANMLRNNQLTSMMVVRGKGKQFENYWTPEQKVPDKALDYPWETCMTMANQWSYNLDDHNKTMYKLIQPLVRGVSKGGNFLLNVNPDLDGELHPVSYERLKKIGDWMKINEEAIYVTKPIKPSAETKLAFTRNENSVYAFYLPEEDEKQCLQKFLFHSYTL